MLQRFINMENRPDLPGLLHLGAPASGGTPEIGPELAELLNKFQKRDIESQLDVVVWYILLRRLKWR